MMLAKIEFDTGEHGENDDACAAIDQLFGALRQNGQTCNDTYPVVYTAGKYVSYTLIPESTSLDSRYHNKYVLRDLARLKEYGINDMRVALLGVDRVSAEVCICDDPEAYILYTTYVSMESPLWCADCFLPIPLYRIPPTYDGEYYDIFDWKTEYQACDTLWMKDEIAVARMYRELSHFDSVLSLKGRNLCAKITALTHKPVYYYLFKFTKTKLSRTKNQCPSCGQLWRIEEVWHDFFELKCDTCYLLGTVFE